MSGGHTLFTVGSGLERFLLAGLMIFACSPPTAAYGQPKDPATTEIENFVANTEKRANAAKAKLAKAIENCEKQISKLPIDKDARALRLQPIKADRSAFESSGQLPSSPELLNDVANFVSTYSDIRTKVQSRLAAEEKKAAKKTTPGGVNLDSLKALDARMARVIDGDSFTAGSTWTGSRQFPDAMMTVALMVDQREGTRFTGRLRQSMGGGTTRMKVEGRIVGNEFYLEKTAMIEGKERYLCLNGVIVKDRIVAAAMEQGPKGRPAPDSWIGLQVGERK